VISRAVLPDAYDAVIVGGGPAGSHLALRLARCGRRVALVEARRFPRAKPCGEFMSPECLGLLDELGLLHPVLAAGGCRISQMVLHGYGHVARGRYLDGDLGTRRRVQGLALRREILDEISLRAAEREAGVALFEGRRVTGLLRERDGTVAGVRVAGGGAAPCEIRAAFTIGADGIRSIVARELDVRREVSMPPRKLAFICRFAGIAQQRFAEVHFIERGYLIAAPVDESTLTLNLIVERAQWPGGIDKLEFVRRYLRQAPSLASKLERATLVGDVTATGPLATHTTRQVFDGAALVGDACGFVDPLTGEGIYFAMRGAALLAPVLDRALARGRRDRGALRCYARARRREFAARATLARLLQRCVRKPALAARVLALLDARPGLMDLVLTVTGDSIPPSRVLNPGVLLPALLRRPVHRAGRSYPGRVSASLPSSPAPDACEDPS
jgi:flavin-dependent dehydrogenase